MDLVQLIYASQPFGYDEAVLYGILTEARRNNVRTQITGCLICRADIFLQLLEGPPAAVEATFQKIARDTRHLDVRILSRTPVQRRIFPGWAMRDDPARSWMWTPEAVAEGAAARTSKPDLLAIFARVASEPA